MSKKTVVFASLTGLAAVACVGVAGMLMAKQAHQPQVAQQIDVTAPPAEDQHSSVAPVTAQALDAPSVATNTGAPVLGQSAAIERPASTGAKSDAASVARLAVASVGATQASASNVQATLKVADAKPAPTQVVQKLVPAAAAVPTQEPVQMAQLRSLQYAQPQTKPMAAPSVAAPPPQVQRAEAVVVTAQRVQQVARVDIDSLGRGNSLTIQLPKRRK
jgi:hypothetical protein